jgi:hypothetical protein
VCLDVKLSLEHQISGVCRSAYWQLKMISKIRDSLTVDACRSLVHSLVTSRLDFQNALYVFLPEKSIKRLQRVQNYAARLIMKTRRQDHITPVLRELHWLPVRQRVSYKTLLLVYQCISETAPLYLSELIIPYVPPRNLRSQDQRLLTVPRTRLKFTERAFAVAGPLLWNKLPADIRMSEDLQTFKSRLKTHLFTLSFS